MSIHNKRMMSMMMMMMMVGMRMGVMMMVMMMASGSTLSAQSMEGFLSIDVGSTATQNYTDAATGIVWTPDSLIWPELAERSTTFTVGPISSQLADQKQYQSFRYFNSTSSSSNPNPNPNPSKFCYPLAASAGSYYLIRVSFWCGSALASAPTRAPGVANFRVIIDSYLGPQLNFNLPMALGDAKIKEYYVKAAGSTLSFCLSAASARTSDAPFLNSLELRPLPTTLFALKVIENPRSALHVLARYDVGAPANLAPIIRYPDDVRDRFWLTQRTGNDEVPSVTNSTINVVNRDNLPPIKVLQSNAVAATRAGLVYNFSLPGSHYYFVSLLFIELDPSVKVGDRVFNLMSNGKLTSTENIDILNETSGKLYSPLQYYTPKATGPYDNYLAIALTPVASSTYLPSLAALEVMQVFDDPIVDPSSSNDESALRAVIAMLPSLSIFKGDPCLPLDYPYPWIRCNADVSPARVTSILLSNYNLVGSFPSSINNLDQLVTILADQNVLQGFLPDLNNLVYLEVLNLSNNKLSGPIPASLATLPRLRSLDLSNNNFSGVIPAALLQKQGFVFNYGGNNFLCTASSTSSYCAPVPPPSPKPPIALIIGIVAGVVVLVIILVIVIARVRRSNVPQNAQQDRNPKNPLDHVRDNEQYISPTRLQEAANVAQNFSLKEIVSATNNFSTIIGGGGFGSVYKGILSNGAIVAVKVLSNTSQQGPQQFLNEVALLSRVRHKNLVELVGYSIDNRLMLVYEFMPGGSLYDALFDKKRTMTLSWRQRLQILLDAAQGLAYLHTGCSSLIIHRDVKSSNILISEKLEGKMSDFGISRLQSDESTNFSTKKLVGSMGYLDPEYANTLRLTEKVDVYSLGVVLLEAMCGQLPIIRNAPTQLHISQWVMPHYEQGVIERVVDRRLGSDYNVLSMWKVAEIAVACVQYNASLRPTMINVCDELNEALRLESDPLHGASLAITGDFNISATDVQAR